MTHVRRIALALPVVAIAAAALAQIDMRPGLWEITVQMEMPGMPGPMPPQTMTQCWTPEDVKNPGRLAGKPPAGDMKCEIADQKKEGTTVTWKMKCTGSRPMTAEGRMTVTGDSYEGVVTYDMGGQRMTVKQKAKRLGDCKK